MAKKKGGRKKGGKKRSGKAKKSETGPARKEEPPTESEEQEEPELAQAVSEVLDDTGKDKEEKAEKKERKTVKKFKTQLARFTADGYDVSEIEAMLDTATVKELRETIKSFKEGIEKNNGIKDALSEMDLTGLGDEAQELELLLSDPAKHRKAAELFEEIKFRKRSAEIMTALKRMVLPAMKPRVDALKEMLKNSRDLEAIESELLTLKIDYKAAYAEEGIKAQMSKEKAEPPRAATKSSMPMVVKDIFLLYKDGKFISHHTNRVVSKNEQKELFADLKKGRDFLRSPKYQPQKLNVIPSGNRSILVQSGRFTVVIVIAEGKTDPWSEKITNKVITLMEKEDQMQLKDWNGDVSVLKNSGKYMQALLFAFMKLSKKGKQ